MHLLKSSQTDPFQLKHLIPGTVSHTYHWVWSEAHWGQQALFCWYSVRLQLDLKNDLHLLLHISGFLCVTIHRWPKFITAVWKPESVSSGGSSYLNRFLSLLALTSFVSKTKVGEYFFWWPFLLLVHGYSSRSYGGDQQTSALVDICYFACWPRFASLAEVVFAF